MPLINVNQIDQTQLSLFVQLASSGSAFSGNYQAYINGSGWAGPNVVYTSGANQRVSGIKEFVDPPLVPYSGPTGSSASKGYADNAVLAASGYLTGQMVGVNNTQSIIGAKTFDVPVTVALPTNSGHAVNAYYLSGVSGVLATAGGGGALYGVMYTSGDQIVTGTKHFISSPLVPNPTVPSGAVSLTYLSGVSGVLVTNAGVGTGYSGYVENTFVHRFGDESITGVKTFVSSPLVPTVPGHISGAVNQGYVSGMSGVLASLATGTTNNYYITGTGIIAANSIGTVTNTFNITSGNSTINNTGTITNTFNGTVNQTTNINQPTGNFVNISFFFDQFNLATGLGLVEGFVSRDFFFTGYGLGAYNSGTQGIVSGSIYQRTTTNTKVELTNFTFNSGIFFTATAGFNTVVSGMNRVGVDILRLGTGVTGFTVGVFGVGY